EQLTYVISGALHFKLGPKGEQELTVRAGEVLVIPSHLPHSALALEDTLDVDVFSPPREEWINKTDDYLRKNTSNPDHRPVQHAAWGRRARGAARRGSPGRRAGAG